MSLLVKASPWGRRIVEVTPESAGWNFVGFAAYRLAPGETLEVAVPGAETCTVVLTGRVSARTAAQRWADIGARASVFDDAAPFAVYAPAGEPVSVVAHTAAEIAVASAPGGGAHAARLIEPAAMKRSTRGQGANTRYVCDILPQTEPAASLLVVEVRTPSGHSSSYPPHKHDRDAPPDETLLEETYYHRLRDPGGFAFQRVYTDDRSLDEAVAVADGDVVLVPRGYHPVSADARTDLYYLNVMAGPRREWRVSVAPGYR